MCMMSPKCHIVYCIVLAWIVQSNLAVANKLLTYLTLDPRGKGGFRVWVAESWAY